MSWVEVGWLETGLLLLLPAIVLALALLFGRYPGEELLTRPMRDRAPRRRRERARPAWIAPVLHVGGGLLLGRSLAGRAPPGLRSCNP